MCDQGTSRLSRRRSPRRRGTSRRCQDSACYSFIVAWSDRASTSCSSPGSGSRITPSDSAGRRSTRIGAGSCIISTTASHGRALHPRGRVVAGNRRGSLAATCQGGGSLRREVPRLAGTGSVVVLHGGSRGEPRMPPCLIDRNPRGREGRLGEGADRNGDDVRYRRKLVEDGRPQPGQK